MFRTSPAKSPVSQCKSSFPPSFARTSSIPRGPAHETGPNYSNVPPGSNCTAAPPAHIHASGKSPPVFPTAPPASPPPPPPSPTPPSPKHTPTSSPPSPPPHHPPTLPH